MIIRIKKSQYIEILVQFESLKDGKLTKIAVYCDFVCFFQENLFTLQQNHNILGL